MEAKPVPTAQSITTVKIQRRRVMFLNYFKRKTDKMAVFNENDRVPFWEPYRYVILDILGNLDGWEGYSFTLLVAVRPLMWTRTRYTPVGTSATFRQLLPAALMARPWMSSSSTPCT